MDRCIFCKSESDNFNTREHILPESLGGGDWAILPSGLFCDTCQNKFGSEIEQQALSDYPFSFFRVFMGIPTKKEKPPWFDSWEGKIKASIKPGQIGYEPSPIFEEATLNNNKTVMRILAHPLHPDMVCRTMLKMGIEVLAAKDAENVFDPRYDSARIYALTGEKDGSWWYLQREDMEEASRMITQGITRNEWIEGIQLAVSEPVNGAEIFHLKLLYLDMFVPFYQKVLPPEMEDLTEPEFRLFTV